ncbi:MAG: F0F1 ATP synthase subunit gamma [Chloroflexota bacterium]
MRPAADFSSLISHLITEKVIMDLLRAMLESAVAEHLARVSTMRMAADNARSLLGDLTAECNVASRHSATSALLDIVTGYRAATEGEA